MRVSWGLDRENGENGEGRGGALVSLPKNRVL